MAIADFDELNIMWVGEMELPPAEKYLRLEMITEFENTFSKIFEKQKRVVKNSQNNTLFLLGLLTVPIATEWRRIYRKYYEKYVSVVGGETARTGYPQADAWFKQHSTDFANWVQQTTENEFNKGTDAETIFSADRIRDIARTESNGIADAATLDGYYRAGCQNKMWVSYRDKKVRATHKEADGQIVPLNQPFVVGDSLLMFPHDTSLGASASEIINCRCVMRPIK